MPLNSGMLRTALIRSRECLRKNHVSLQRRFHSPWTEQVASEKVQSYISKSNDPYLNLSIEHFLLQNSPPDSTILFLYVNRPCAVIGRNQNPWLELNLRRLKADQIDLVRRRSGGGTVFHDEGNMNWTVICPPDIFTRDKHAEMVVRALRSAGINRARVNERHDIVLDQGPRRGIAGGPSPHAPNVLHSTAYTAEDESDSKPLKVSGSAYKLTRTRALHHGTCLLNSKYLRRMPQYLRSPGKPFIKAKGVESVSSPVANIGLDRGAFENGVQQQFHEMYASERMSSAPITVGFEALDHHDIKSGFEELKTPQFNISSFPTEDDPRQKPAIEGVPSATKVWLSVRHGIFKEAEIRSSAQECGDELKAFLEGSKVHETPAWSQILAQFCDFTDTHEAESLALWLENTLPTGLAQTNQA